MKYQLAAADREKFGLPEWIAFDRDKLDDTPYSVLARWEKEIGAPIVRIVHAEWQAKTALGVKGYMWLALQLAGIDSPSFDDFDIRITSVKALVGGEQGTDPDPLAENSSDAPPAAAE